MTHETEKLQRYSYIGLIVVWLIFRSVFHSRSNVIDLGMLVAAGILGVALGLLDAKHLKNKAAGKP